MKENLNQKVAHNQINKSEPWKTIIIANSRNAKRMLKIAGNITKEADLKWHKEHPPKVYPEHSIDGSDWNYQ